VLKVALVLCVWLIFKLDFDFDDDPYWILASLTPKIPSIFLPISAVSDLVGGIHFSTKKSMRT
jgi:hypothetical protein